MTLGYFLTEMFSSGKLIHRNLNFSWEHSGLPWQERFPITHGITNYSSYHRPEQSKAQCHGAQQEPICSLHDPKNWAWIPVSLSPSGTSGHHGAGCYGKGFVLHLAWIAKSLLKQGTECGAPTLQVNSLSIRIQIQSNSLLLELRSFVIIRHWGRECECAQYFDIYCIGKLYTNAHLSQQRLRKCLKAVKYYLPPDRWVTNYCHIKHSFSEWAWERQWWTQTWYTPRRHSQTQNCVPSCNHTAFSSYTDSVADNKMMVYVVMKTHKTWSIQKPKAYKNPTSQT